MEVDQVNGVIEKLVRDWGIKNKTFWLVLSALLLMLVACAKQPPEQSSADGSDLLTPGYQTITADEAISIMEENDSFILLDVRTESEFLDARIDGAILLPDYDIAQLAEEQLPDQEALILVYCRSGRRSALAAETLADLGYTNVYDFGGIIDWPYETVSG